MSVSEEKFDTELVVLTKLVESIRAGTVYLEYRPKQAAAMLESVLNKLRNDGPYFVRK